jgi:hypothetical protein
MNGLVKSGTVLGGYIIAVFVASVAVAIRIARTDGPDAQASAGMYAFGDALLFLAVFGVMSLVPTGMALFFLRPYRWFWTVLSLGTLALAATGLAATAVYVWASYQALPRSPLESWAALAVLRMLPAPLLATSFLLSGLLATTRSSRWALLVAAGIEGAVGSYAFLHWFASCCWI